MAITPSKPIFCATHPRACSTAFERVFMARRDKLACVHEPFGDAFYYGPERMGERFSNDAEGRENSGFSATTYADVLRQIEEAGKESNKRVFVKDMAQYLVPPNEGKADIAPSAGAPGSEPGNPTLLPLDTLRKFQWTFLIRHPRRSIPSYYRCTVPPLDEMTGFFNFMPCEAGYVELRRLFDFLVKEGVVDESNLMVVDADDLLDDPEGIIRAYCEHVGLDFTDNMLNWGEEDTRIAQEKFAKWTGFHEDALGSTSLKPRNKAHVSPPKLPFPHSAASSKRGPSLAPRSFTLFGISLPLWFASNLGARWTATVVWLGTSCTMLMPREKKVITRESEEAEWKQKFGEKGLKEIRECVDANVKDYEYLKKFAIRV